MAKSVQLKVNTTNLLKVLSNAFDGHTSVIRELAQNAYRAHATKVSFLYNEADGILSVSDNGTQPMDFDALMSIGDSGWDLDIIDNEQPFGIGFLSAIYAGDRIEIKSGGHVLSCATSEILNQEEVSVVDCEFEIGTSINIHLKEEVKRSIISEINKHTGLFLAFPIEVYVNGDAIDRRYSRESCIKRDMIRVEMDNMEVFFPPEWKSDTFGFGYGVICQGFKMANESTGNDAIVFLDKNWSPRVPDRTQLFNSKEASFRIAKSVAEASLTWLKNLDCASTTKKIKMCTELNIKFQQVEGFNSFSAIVDSISPSDLEWYHISEMTRIARSCYEDEFPLDAMPKESININKPFLIAESNDILLNESSHSSAYAIAISAKIPVVVVPVRLGMLLDFLENGVDIEEFVEDSSQNIVVVESAETVIVSNPGFHYSEIHICPEIIFKLESEAFGSIEVKSDVDAFIDNQTAYIMDDASKASRYAHEIAALDSNYIDECDHHDETHEYIRVTEIETEILNATESWSDILLRSLNRLPEQVKTELLKSKVSFALSSSGDIELA